MNGREESHPILRNLKSLDIPFCLDLTETWSSFRTHRRIQDFSRFFRPVGITTEEKFVTPSDLILVTVVFSWAVEDEEDFWLPLVSSLLSLMPSFPAWFSFSPAIDFRLRFLTKEEKKKGRRGKKKGRNEMRSRKSRKLRWMNEPSFTPFVALHSIPGLIYLSSVPPSLSMIFLLLWNSSSSCCLPSSNDSRSMIPPETHPSTCSSFFYPLISWRQEKGRKRTTMTRQDQDNKERRVFTSLLRRKSQATKIFGRYLLNKRKDMSERNLVSVWTKDRRKSNHTKSPEEE